MVEHITDKLVKDLEPENKTRIIFDEALKGFGIRVSAGGTKTFVFHYRNGDGTQRQLKIGIYGRNQWSVEAARKEAGEKKKAVARGEDPQGEKRAKREAETLADLCGTYAEVHLPLKRPSSQRNDIQMIENIINPKLGTRKLVAITHNDLIKFHHAMAATPIRANRVLALLSRIFNLAIRRGLLESNPCRGVQRFHEPKRTRHLNAEEIGRLMQVLDAHPQTRADRMPNWGNADKVRADARAWGTKAANVIRLCLLTGCRVGEALGATVDQFDLDAPAWNKPGATTKQKTEHNAPLGAAAVMLVKQILDERDVESRYLFPGRTPDVPMDNLKRDWAIIRKAAKIEDVRVHDLRHTFASMLASSGASLPMIGALLGHTQPGTTQRYAHLFADPLRKAADEVGNIVTGKKSAEVFKLKKDGAA